MSNRYYVILVSLFSLIYLGACAERNIPQIQPEPTLSNSNRDTETINHAEVQESAEQPSAVLGMLGCIERADSLQSAVIAKEIAQLQTKLQSSALAEHIHQNHLILACLLSRDSATNAQLARAQALFDGLASELSPEERLLMLLLKRKISLQIKLRQHQGKLSGLRVQNRELLEKIEQLKGLERDLDVTNIPIPEPGL